MVRFITLLNPPFEHVRMFMSAVTSVVGHMDTSADLPSQLVMPTQTPTPMVTPEQLAALQELAAKVQSQGESEEGEGAESDEEEPSQEALMRYMALRRHTIGVGDSQHEAPQDVRAKLAQHKPILGRLVIKLGMKLKSNCTVRLINN